jgi:hypothetical protein
MRLTLISLSTLGVLALSSVARADNAAAAAPTTQQAVPRSSAPGALPPPPATNPPVPSAQPLEHPPLQAPVATQAPAPPLPPGQWVFTQQYGWLWMPYGQGYTHVIDDAALAYEYAYYPTFGWRWVVAPWVLGFGVTPYWGAFGPRPFAWYAHPWFRVGTAHLSPSWGSGVGARGGFRSGGGHMSGHGRR